LSPQWPYSPATLARLFLRCGRKRWQRTPSRSSKPGDALLLIRSALLGSGAFFFSRLLHTQPGSIAGELIGLPRHILHHNGRRRGAPAARPSSASSTSFQEGLRSSSTKVWEDYREHLESPHHRANTRTPDRGARRTLRARGALWRVAILRLTELAERHGGARTLLRAMDEIRRAGTEANMRSASAPSPTASIASRTSSTICEAGPTAQAQGAVRGDPGTATHDCRLLGLDPADRVGLTPNNQLTTRSYSYAA